MKRKNRRSDVAQFVFLFGLCALAAFVITLPLFVLNGVSWVEIATAWLTVLVMMVPTAAASYFIAWLAFRRWGR